MDGKLYCPSEKRSNTLFYPKGDFTLKYNAVTVCEAFGMSGVPNPWATGRWPARGLATCQVVGRVRAS